MSRCSRRLHSIWKIFKPLVSRFAGSSGSGFAPATWCNGRRNSPPDFYGDVGAIGCESARRQLRRSSMAAKLVPLGPRLSVAGRLDRADIDALAQAGVRTIVNNRPDGEDPGQLPAADARRIAESQGLVYHHIPITAATLSRADVD